jgi:hypothetical protein
MPIRPEISLQTSQAPQLDPFVGVERGMKLQQLAMQPAILEQQMATARQAEATSRAAQMTSEAQLPGVAAEAAGKVRGERQANERITAAQNAFDLDDKGNPVVDAQTGQPKFNLAKYQYGLHKAGLVDEAFKVAGTALGQSKDAYNFTAGVRTDLAIGAKAVYDKTPGTPAQKEKAAKQFWEDYSGRAVAASQQGQFPLSQEQFRYTPGIEQALYTAAINPQAQEVLKQGIAGQDIQRAQLGLQVEQFNNSKLTNFTDDASLDPNSQVSIMSREIAKNAGMKVNDNMSAGDIHRNDLTKGVLTSVGAAAGASKKAADAQVNQLAAASSALENAKDVLAKNKITPLNLLQNNFNLKLLDDPKLAALYAQIQQLPDKSVINAGMDYNAVKAVLDGLAVNAKANAVSAVGGNPAKPEATTPNAANVTKIKSNEEYRALPSGTVFTGPDGIRRTKP